MKGAVAFLVLGAAAGAATLAVSATKAMLEVYVSTSANTAGARMLRLQLGGGGVEEISFEGNPVLTVDSVRFADALVAPGDGGEIRISLQEDAARRLADVTSRNVGHRLGIVVAGRLRAAPVVVAPITNGVLVVGGLETREAEALARRLGPPAPTSPAAAAPDSAVAAAAFRVLEGTWILRRATHAGEIIPDRKFSGGAWTFSGGGLSATNGEGQTVRFTLAPEPGAADAFRLDPVPPSSERAIRMLFRVEGDLLTVAFFDGISGFPVSFEPERKKTVLELSKKSR